MYMQSLIYKNQAKALYVMWGILSPRAKQIIKSPVYVINILILD